MPTFKSLESEFLDGPKEMEDGVIIPGNQQPQQPEQPPPQLKSELVVLN
jgi:hypothetical protein